MYRFVWVFYLEDFVLMGFVLFVELGDCCGWFEIKKLDNDCDVIEI